MRAKRSLHSSRAVFTAEELGYCSSRPDPIESLTGVFAAKEAFLKAADVLGGLPRYSYPEVEIGHEQSGRPRILMCGALDEHFRRAALHVDVSISHCSGMAGSVVLIWQDLGPGQVEDA